MTEILIVEDDEAFCEVLKDGLEYEGHRVRVVSDGRAALAAIAAERPDLVLLDLMLPGESGLDVCRKLRANGDRTPIVMLTARGLEADRVRGLRLGADDYLGKPFGFEELLARIEAVLRRSPPDARADDRIAFGPFVIDRRAQRVTRDGTALELRPREFAILAYLASKSGEVATRDELLRSVWGYRRPPDTRTVDVHVARLRSKLEDDPGAPRMLVTVARRGYRLVVDAPRTSPPRGS